MLRRTAAAAQPTRTTEYVKLCEVYCMQYGSPAPAGTSALSASRKHRVMRPATGGSSLA